MLRDYGFNDVEKNKSYCEIFKGNLNQIVDALIQEQPDDDMPPVQPKLSDDEDSGSDENPQPVPAEPLPVPVVEEVKVDDKPKVDLEKPIVVDP